MILGGVSPDKVAELYPLAPAVSKKDVQAGSDWAEGELGAETPPAPETRQYRELQRAVAAYALYLATAGQAASLRLSSTAASGAVKSIQLGTLKLERAAVNTEAVAAGARVSASEWLEIAGRHLAGAGIGGVWAFPGASR